MVIPGAGENSAALQISPAALQNSDAPAAFHSSLLLGTSMRVTRVTVQAPAAGRKMLLRRLAVGARGLRRGAAAAAGVGAAVAWAAQNPAPPAQAASMSANRVLGPPGGRHRVALTAWPINDDPCGSFSTPEQLFAHAKRAGYDGLELTVDDFRKTFFAGQSYERIIAAVKALSASTGVQIVGSLYHVSDGGWRREHEDGAPGRWDLDFNEADFFEELARRIALDKALGSEYVTFQISLPPEYLNTGGEYRDDAAFVRRSAERIARMQQICFEQGMNFYVETRTSTKPLALLGSARVCPLPCLASATVRLTTRVLWCGHYLCLSLYVYACMCARVDTASHSHGAR